MNLFDKFNVEDIIVNDKSFNLANSYDKYDNVETIHIEKEDEDYYYVEATVNVLGRIGICWFCYDSNYKIFDYDCDCEWCNNNSPCGHIGAVLLKLNDLDIDEFPFDYKREVFNKPKVSKQEDLDQRMLIKLQYLSSSTKNIINKQKKEHQNLVTSLMTHEKYEITPYFNIDDGKYFLEYKVGNNKKYIIKDIDTFLTNCKRNEYVKYGKYLAFVHNCDAFSESALKQISFMEKANEIYNTLMKKKNYFSLYYDYGYDYRLDRYLDLNRYNLDIFFDTYKDFEIDNLNFIEADKIIELNLITIDNYYLLEYKDDYYYFGEKYVYNFDLNYKYLNLNRYNFDNEGKCRNFLCEFENNKLVILKDDFKDFYKYVLFPIKDYLSIKNMIEFNENNYEYIKMYGDINDDSQISFKIYYVNENQDRVIAFQNDFITNYNQDIVEKYILSVGKLDNETNTIYLDLNDESTYEFLHEGIEFLKQYAEVYISEALKRFGKRTNYAVTVGVKIENDLLALDIASSDIPKMEIAKVLEQYRHKKKYYRLKNGDLLYLNSPELEELSQIIDQYHLTTKDISDGTIKLNKNRAFSFLEDNNQFEYLQLERKESFQKLITQFDQSVHQKATLSPYYQDILRDYQKEGYQWLRTIHDCGFNGILADDMGLGKTLQVIALIELLKLKQVSIVICPSSLIYNWEDEVNKFASDLKVKCIVGNQSIRQNIINEVQNYRLVITSYDYMRRDYQLYQQVEFGYIILDESQYIKNQKTKNAQSVKELKGLHKLALSGTPIENSLAELWSVFDFLMPQYLFNYHYFKKQYESKIVKDHDEEAIKQLRKLVSPFILRRNKKDVLLELPDKIEKTQIIPFTSKESELYFANLAQVNQELQALFQTEAVDKIQILAMLTKLRQICCEPRMIYENIDEVSSKMKACLELINSYKMNNQKVLLFSTFTKVFDLFEEEFYLNGITYFKLTGTTSKEKRKEYVDRFQNNEVDVFLISLKAGGTGLNLTQAEAVIHFDPWWNLSAQNQATDRAYRIGQHKNVQVHKLIMKDSIEEKIQKLQNKKKELADMFVENNEGNITSLSKDELMELFS
ncbi:DEAD/DEAH box helicase [Thomasclavelia cocleata]|uniref:DEAD/DEAH box helicase n=1 Tax=Thomasclavelia cocleata TaxID=69824 RepID=UPI00242D5126|nr:DEAD/DEAH box helicase [Thomasclavelia cocleata]